MHLTIRKRNLIKQVLRKIKLIAKARIKINVKQKVRAKAKAKINKYKNIKRDKKNLKDLSIQIIYKFPKNLTKYYFQKNKITAEKKIYQIKK